VQNISWAAPLTPVVSLNRALFNGEFHMEHLMALGLVIGYSILFFALSLVTMRRRLTK